MIVIVLLHLLVAPLPGPAGTPGDTAIVLPRRARVADALGDTVVVLPRGGAARRRMPTASITELDARAAGRALETVAELLGEAAGVRVQQYGGLGAFCTVSLRGAPPGQVAIFLDGAPLSAAAHGVVSLGDLPATAIERIEVYRGSAPLALGPAAPGGAVNVVTLASP
ncbi:MAG: TonB-dependent receptor, partial [Candidatus Eiseniibacteriota bacterium]